MTTQIEAKIEAIMKDWHDDLDKWEDCRVGLKTILEKHLQPTTEEKEVDLNDNITNEKYTVD